MVELEDRSRREAAWEEVCRRRVPEEADLDLDDDLASLLEIDPGDGREESIEYKKKIFAIGRVQSTVDLLATAKRVVRRIFVRKHVALPRPGGQRSSSWQPRVTPGMPSWTAPKKVARIIDRMNEDMRELQDDIGARKRRRISSQCTGA